jgi:hypothetical protein
LQERVGGVPSGCRWQIQIQQYDRRVHKTKDAGGAGNSVIPYELLATVACGGDETLPERLIVTQHEQTSLLWPIRPSKH